MVKLEYTRIAFTNLKSIRKSIAENSLHFAKLSIIELRNRIEVLKVHPETGKSIYPDKYQHLRQLLHKSYYIIYYYENNKVTIITVHNQSRLRENLNVVNQVKIQ
jgi:plasmid stabilization system protein ParE